MNKPIRTTLVFGLLSALGVFPVVLLLSSRYGWPLAFKVTLWADLAVYCILLARWSRTRLIAIVFPLLILLGAALWPAAHAGFLLLALGILSWVRSGICFKAPALRRITAEVIAVVGGAGLVAVWAPQSALAWALGVWLFYLVQALYFFVMPGLSNDTTQSGEQDPFETALQAAEKVLDS